MHKKGVHLSASRMRKSCAQAADYLWVRCMVAYKMCAKLFRKSRTNAVVHTMYSAGHYVIIRVFHRKKSFFPSVFRPFFHGLHSPNNYYDYI